MWCGCRRRQRQQEPPQSSRMRQRLAGRTGRQQHHHRHYDQHRSIWELIQGAHWSALYTLLVRDPPCSSQQQRQQDIPHHKRRYLAAARAKLPMLSYSLWMGAPVVIVQAFLDRCPAAIHDTDNQGRLPLHVACICQRCPSIIDVLLEHVPNSRSAAIRQDRRGNVPLHYAIQAAIVSAPSSSATTPTTPRTLTDNDDTMDILTSLLAVCPQAAMVQNTAHETAVTLSQRLPDAAARKVIYTMLVRTHQTLSSSSTKSSAAALHHHHQYNSSSFTAPSSSHFWDTAEPSSLSLCLGATDNNTNNNPNSREFLASRRKDVCCDCEQYEDEEPIMMIEFDEPHQAVGERPKRRNGMVVVSTVGSTV